MVKKLLLLELILASSFALTGCQSGMETESNTADTVRNERNMVDWKIKNFQAANLCRDTNSRGFGSHMAISVKNTSKVAKDTAQEVLNLQEIFSHRKNAKDSVFMGVLWRKK